MSWGQYLLLQRGYWQKQNRIWEEDWKQTRHLYWVLYNANVEKDKQQTRQELMPLPSDSGPKKVVKKTAKESTLDFFNALAAFDVSEN